MHLVVNFQNRVQILYLIQSLTAHYWDIKNQNKREKKLRSRGTELDRCRCHFLIMLGFTRLPYGLAADCLHHHPTPEVCTEEPLLLATFATVVCHVCTLPHMGILLRPFFFPAMAIASTDKHCQKKYNIQPRTSSCTTVASPQSAQCLNAQSDTPVFHLPLFLSVFPSFLSSSLLPSFFPLFFFFVNLN